MQLCFWDKHRAECRPACAKNDQTISNNFKQFQTISNNFKQFQTFQLLTYTTLLTPGTCFTSHATKKLAASASGASAMNFSGG